MVITVSSAIPARGTACPLHTTPSLLRVEKPSTMVYAVMASRLFDSGDFYDVTIVCGSQAWDFHKNILVMQCEYFRRACASGKYESEAESIPPHDDNATAVGTMLASGLSENLLLLCNMAEHRFVFMAP